MSPALLLDKLKQAGAEMWVEDGQLVVRAPNDALDSGLRRQLADHKEALLRLQLQNEKRSRQPPQIKADAASRHEPFELTEIQQAYWLGRNPCLELGKVGIHVYHELDCRDLHLGRLQEAWQQVIDRHDMMRAVLLPDGRQAVREEASYEIEVLDLRLRPRQDRRDKLARLRRQMSHHVYSPAEWPMFRIVACLIEDALTRLYVSIDALNLDMGSLAIIFSDWVRFYTSQDQPPAAPQLSFRDYALALDALKDSESYRESLSYWEKRIEGLPPAPDLPRGLRPEDLPRQRFVRRDGHLPAEEWASLKQRAAACGLTPSGLTLAAYAEAVGGWCRQPEFTLNVTLFNRLPLHPEVDLIAGDFTSMVLLAVDRTEGNSFSQRARRIQRQLWRDMKHRYVSGIEVLRRLSQLQGNTQGQALMPCVFTSTLNHRARGLVPLRRLGDPVYSIVQTPQVSLDLQVCEEQGELFYHLDTVEGLYAPGVVDGIFQAYRSLIGDLARGESRWTQERRHLLPADQLQRRKESNDTDRPVPELTLPQWLQGGVRQGPERPALMDGDRTLSHRETERLSSRLAHRLRGMGAVRDKLIAVVTPKGWRQITGVLGILKAGSAYMPIDPQVPARRLRHLLRDGEVRIALTTQDLAASLAWPSDVRLVCLDGDALTSGESEDLAAVGKPRDLAYVLYTSGSTGHPKGAMIEQRSVINRMLDINRRFEVGPNDRALALTALHHDLSVFDMFGVLAAGGSLVFPTGQGADPAGWLQPCVRHGVTLWNSVPAFMEILVDYLEHKQRAGELPELPPLRLVLLSGDWIPKDLPDRIRALFKQAKVVSLGGPTETTVWDVHYPIGDVDPNWNSVPYGRPLHNARYYILNESLEPCPDWVEGEMHLAGTGLMRGYWGDAEKTRRAFVRHPDSGRRLYRSGDLGRYLPDGNIEILGRKDLQIKIRGQRIEPGEIEEALKQHPEVKSAVVEAQGDSSQDRQLVAYFVADGSSPEGTDGAGAAPRPESRPAAEANEPPDPSSRQEELDRFQFKLEQRGLRRDLEERPRTALPGAQSPPSPQRYGRQSQRDYSGASLSMAQVDRLLSCLRATRLEGRPLAKYRYPSAGNLYPVQTYLSVRPGRVEGLEGGTYYYHPLRHELVSLSSDGFPSKGHVAVNREFAPGAPLCLLLVGCHSAIRPLYGELSRTFCLLEAGAMMQLLMEQAEPSGIGLCPVGEFDLHQAGRLLQLGNEHEPLLCLVGGPPRALPALANDLCSLPALRDQELRRFLEERLPEHMIPSRFVQLDSLPLSANGKVDRKALRQMDAGRPPAVTSPTADGSDMEALVGKITRRILGIDSVDPSLRFSQLGAHSMHLLRIAMQLSESLGREVEVSELFRHPTPLALARFLSGEEEDTAPAEEAAKRARMRRQALGRLARRKEPNGHG
ncbi:MAG TPA: amino acid adenylation domain-containing protein [Acidobacteriota bacterium]|nr:amino acid adenylation domain-containing protein [Acidobacteriota bacterium]